jgi:hypothetical protein
MWLQCALQTQLLDAASCHTAILLASASLHRLVNTIHSLHVLLSYYPGKINRGLPAVAVLLCCCAAVLYH